MTDHGVPAPDVEPGVGPTPGMRSAYDQRWQCVLDCVALRTPDRMPIGLMMNYWLARYGGITHREQMYDYEKVTQIAERMVDEFEPDFFTSPFVMTTFGPLLDGTDLGRAFDVLGDVAALRGGLPSSLLIAGTPPEIDAAVRELVERVFRRGGKLIFDSGFGIPDEAPIENVHAMFEAARRYGS